MNLKVSGQSPNRSLRVNFEQNSIRSQRRNFFLRTEILSVLCPTLDRIDTQNKLKHLPKETASFVSNSNDFNHHFHHVFYRFQRIEFLISKI